MEADFDLEGLAKDLLAFRESVSFHLTDEPPVPREIAEKLWRAHDAAAAALDELKRRYGYAESGWTVYAPDGFKAEE